MVRVQPEDASGDFQSERCRNAEYRFMSSVSLKLLPDNLLVMNNLSL